MTRSSLKAISLFSGAGGMDVGFARAGTDIIFANEIDRDASLSYIKNHGSSMRPGDIRDYLDSIHRLRGVDVVFGGPPCQGFSVAGKMDPNDERSGLIRTFFDVVDCVRPAIFVCENVKALAVLSRWKNVREELIGRASKDYTAALVVLNAHNFGVPQSRERMFLLGIRRDVLCISPEVFDSLIKFELARLECSPPTVGDIIRSLGRAGGEGNSRVCNAKITYAKKPVLRRSPYAGMIFNGAGRPLNSLGSSSTLPASMGGNKTPIVEEDVIFEGCPSFVQEYHRHLLLGGEPYHGEAPRSLRRLTIDECLAIQTFPANYQLHGSQSAMYRQIGNAVPCLLAEAVCRSVTQVLFSGADLHP